MTEWDGYPSDRDQSGWHILRDQQGVFRARWDGQVWIWQSEFGPTALPFGALRAGWQYVRLDRKEDAA